MIVKIDLCYMHNRQTSTICTFHFTLLKLAKTDTKPPLHSLYWLLHVFPFVAAKFWWSSNQIGQINKLLFSLCKYQVFSPIYVEGTLIKTRNWLLKRNIRCANRFFCLSTPDSLPEPMFQMADRRFACIFPGNFVLISDWYSLSE